MAEKKKTTTPKKKTASTRQSAPKKSPAQKTVPKKKSAAKPKEPKSWGKMSIAERTAFRKRNKGTITACLFMVLLLLAAVFFRFCVAGYSFTAYVCVAITFVIAFYTFVPKLFKNSRTVIRIVTFLLCVFLLVAGITEALIIKASFGSPHEECEYLLVLGAKVRSDGPSLSLLDRINRAYEYLTEHPNAIAVVSGGKGADEPITEAKCMYDSLVALGISPERIWMEEQATSTWENLQYSLALIEEKTGQRPTKLAVLSSEYHLFRASLFTKAAGAEFIGIPAKTSYPILRMNYFLREVAGVWHYILLGGQYHASLR